MRIAETLCSDRRKQFEEFVAGGRTFVCEFGRRALEQGRFTIVELPPTTDDNVIDQDRVHAGLSDLVEGRSDVCAYIQPKDLDSHQAEYKRTMHMYRQLCVACGRYSGRSDRETLEREAHEHTESFFLHPENFQQFREKSGLLECRDDQFNLVGMSNLYLQPPRVEARWSPVSAHVLASVFYAEELRSKEPQTAWTIQARACEGSDYIHNMIAPYILPDDRRFWQTGYCQSVERVERVLGQYGGSTVLDARRLMTNAFREAMQLRVRQRGEWDEQQMQRVVDIMLQTTLFLQARPELLGASDPYDVARSVARKISHSARTGDPMDVPTAIYHVLNE